ncbi:MAG: excinuclease ABC subunit UvrC [Ruaniaceae bacterium]|nr:excinuclease ABC subunit UvrC [Ruaniaceae bacterium]
MADPASYRPRNIPLDPGVYRFRDPEGRVLYVGKARNLRARLANYFADPARLNPRINLMVHTASQVEWTIVSTEVEALTLEYTWIKQFQPRFNIVFRDDKSYPYLALSLLEEFPRAFVTRAEHQSGTRYFGPYTHAWAIREVLDLLLRVFPIRSCSKGVFQRAARQGRPCLLAYIDKCSAPCVGRITAQEHRALVDEFADFLAGDSSRFIRQIEEQMRAAASRQDFELAAKLRDDAAALRRVGERNTVVLPPGTQCDIFALATDELHASVQVFTVRDGKIVSQRGWVTDRADDAADGELVSRLLTQAYGPLVEGVDEATGIPREVLVPAVVEPSIAQWLSEARGAKVSVRVPQRGEKRRLMDTAKLGAQKALASEKLRRGSDLNARSRALSALAEHLGLEDAPLRIESYDISHTQGTHQVGSMVVFEDGIPKKRDYRHFNIKGPEGAGERDDTAALAEVLRRRFARAGEKAPLPEAEIGAPREEPTSFAYEPGLLLIDGGLPQVNAAARTLSELGIDVPVAALAKRLEELWLPDEEFPVIVPRGSEALHLVQRIRDEAHRVAISRHRARRSAGMTASVLDTIPGVGPSRRKALEQRFRTVAAIRDATVEQIAEVPGIGPALAEVIAEHVR